MQLNNVIFTGNFYAFLPEDRIQEFLAEESNILRLVALFLRRFIFISRYFKTTILTISHWL